MSLAEQKFLILMKSSLSMIFFMYCTFHVISKKSLTPRFSPSLSSRNFIVLHFTFSSVIHSELIFVKGTRSVSRFIFWHVDV